MKVTGETAVQKIDKKIILTLWVPHMMAEAERLRHTEIAPIVVVSGYRPHDVIVDYEPSIEDHSLIKGEYLYRFPLLKKHATLLVIDHEYVAKIDHKLLQLLKDFSPLIERKEIGNYYLDLTGTGRLFGRELETAGVIVRRIKRDFSLTVRAGIGSNVLVSHVASRLAGDYGVYGVFHRAEGIFLAPLRVELFPFLTPDIRRELTESYNIRYVRELTHFSSVDLDLLFPGYGKRLYSSARGFDRSRLFVKPEKQILAREIVPCAECNDDASLKRQFLQAILELASDMRQKNILPRRYILIVVYQDDYRIVERGAIDPPSFLEPSLARAMSRSFAHVLRRRTRIKKVTLKFSHFIAFVNQETLFPEASKEYRLAEACDTIRKKFGMYSIQYGA